MPRLPGLPDVEITLRRSARARRVSLRVSRTDGRVVLTLPQRMRESAALAFLSEHEDWLRKTLAARPVSIPAGLGAAVPVEGRMVTLVPGTGRAARIEGDRLILPGNPDSAGTRAQALLKAMARDRLAMACDGFAAVLGRRYAALSLRDTRSRWGSCSHEGRLMFNWRLVMAPPPVLAYVAAHEVAHLAEMNHGPDFWATVARLFPGYEPHRRWLKARGETLHSYRFAA